MTEPLTITGNPSIFTDASDLTDETHDAILTILEREIESATGPDFFKAALRAISKVGTTAILCGWDFTASWHLERVAADIYADIFRDATLDLTARRRTVR